MRDRSIGNEVDSNQRISPFNAIPPRVFIIFIHTCIMIERLRKDGAEKEKLALQIQRALSLADVVFLDFDHVISPGPSFRSEIPSAA